ncbi:MAG TPA: hypothetical protein VGL81_24990 [Polyangiaceae bacterium]|jgi:hypothetical protein
MTRALLFSPTALALLLSTGGCEPTRALVQPRSVEPKELGYIYFIEQEAQKDSRLKRCEILPDNSVKCAVEFDLK